MMFGLQTGTDSRLPFSPRGVHGKRVINALKKSKVMKQKIQIPEPAYDITEFFAHLGIIASSLSLLIIAAALGG